MQGVFDNVNDLASRDAGPHLAQDDNTSEWFLVGRVAEQESPRQIPLHTFPFVVGRSDNASLSVQCKTVSSFHAEFDGTADSLIVRDMGSRNGTFVNGHRVEQAIPLCPNDLVQFSTLPFRVMRQWAKVNTSTANEDVIDNAMSLVQFDTLLNENAVIAYYQPIVDLQQQNIIGYEALARSHVVGLEEPAKMFSAAAQKCSGNGVHQSATPSFLEYAPCRAGYQRIS